MIQEKLQHKIDFKTKPQGALGVLEKLALQIGTIQNSLSPTLVNPTILVFAADHGIALDGVSAYPQEVTFQMVLNFLQGGAAINVFCRQHGMALKVVDAGVNYDFPDNTNLINRKVGKGTKSFLHEKAMTEEAMEQCLENGAALMEPLSKAGCNVVGFGEMGIGNTSSAAMLMSALCAIPIEKCVGRGTGLDDVQLQNKILILKRAQEKHGVSMSAKEMLQTYGGFEIAQMCGAMLKAYECNSLILVDGFIATSAFLVAHRLNPKISNNAVFCHLSDESGHGALLSYLNATPLLRLDMRLGEGSGCAVAYPLLESAVAFLNEMASFESAGVSNKD